MNLNSFNQTGTASSLQLLPLINSGSNEEEDLRAPACKENIPAKSYTKSINEEDLKAPTCKEIIQAKSYTRSINDLNQTQMSFQGVLQSQNENLSPILEEYKPNIPEKKQEFPDLKDKADSQSNMRNDNPDRGMGFDELSDVTNRLSETYSEVEGLMTENTELTEYDKGKQKEEQRHFGEAEKLYREMIRKNPIMVLHMLV